MKLTLTRRSDGEVELYHDAGFPIGVELASASTVHSPRSQVIAHATSTQLLFPTDDHEWVNISTLGEVTLTEHCPHCGGSRITDPRPRA